MNEKLIASLEVRKCILPIQLVNVISTFRKFHDNKGPGKSKNKNKTNTTIPDKEQGSKSTYIKWELIAGLPLIPYTSPI